MGRIFQLRSSVWPRNPCREHDRKGVIEAAVIDEKVILSALVGAIVWDIVTWRLGLPTSSSHALIGGLIGAGVASAGNGRRNCRRCQKIGAFIVISPFVGFIGAVFLAIGVMRLYARVAPSTSQGVFPPLAAGVRCGLQSEPWLKRCPEDDGGHRRAPL